MESFSKVLMHNLILLTHSIMLFESFTKKHESIELQTTSLSPVKSDAITGNPVDIPSMAIRPNPSYLEGISCMLAL